MTLAGYVADPQDDTTPPDAGVAMGYSFAEIRALKTRVNEFDTQTQQALSDVGNTLVDHEDRITATEQISDAVDENQSAQYASSAAVYAVNQALLEFKQAILHVGVHIFTDDDTFDPATEFGFGSWARVAPGHTLISRKGTITAADYETTGQVYGAFTKTLGTNEIPAHTHADSFSIESAGAHTHNSQPGSFNGRSYGGSSSGSTSSTRGFVDNDNPQQATTSAGAHSHTLSGSVGVNTTTGASFSLMQPSKVTNIWVRTS